MVFSEENHLLQPSSRKEYDGVASASQDGEEVESSSLTTAYGNPASFMPIILGAFRIVVIGASATADAAAESEACPRTW